MAILHPATPTLKITVHMPTLRPSNATSTLAAPTLQTATFIYLAHIYKYGPDQSFFYKYGTGM